MNWKPTDPKQEEGRLNRMEQLTVTPMESTSRFYVIYNTQSGKFVGHLGSEFPRVDFAIRFQLREEAASFFIRNLSPINHRILAVKAVYEFSKV